MARNRCTEIQNMNKSSILFLALLLLLVLLSALSALTGASVKLCRTVGSNGTFTDGEDAAVDPTTGEVYFVTSSRSTTGGHDISSTLYKLGSNGTQEFTIQRRGFFFDQVAVDALGNVYLGVSTSQPGSVFSQDCPTPISRSAVVGLNPANGQCRFALPRDAVVQLEGDTVGPNVYVNYANYMVSPGFLVVEKVNSVGQSVIPTLALLFQNPPATRYFDVHVAQNGSVSVLSVTIPPRGIPGATQQLTLYDPLGNVISTQDVLAGRVQNYAFNSRDGKYYAILTADPRFICGVDYSQTHPPVVSVLASLDCSATQNITDFDLRNIRVSEDDNALYLFGSNKLERYDILPTGFMLHYRVSFDISNSFTTSEVTVDRDNNRLLVSGSSAGTLPVVLGNSVFPRRGPVDAALATVDAETGVVCADPCRPCLEA